jgi:hypothetical protein
MFDEGHQKMLESLQEVTSVWFMNVLMKTLIRHKYRTKESEKLTEEEIQLLTHADKTIILMYLGLYCVSRMNERLEKALEQEIGDIKQIHCGEQLDSLLLVFYILIDMDLQEFRHHGPQFLESNSNLVN